MIVDLLVMILVLSLAVFIVERLIPFEPMFLNVMRVIIGIVALLWLLSIIGVVDGFPRLR